MNEVLSSCFSMFWPLNKTCTVDFPGSPDYKSTCQCRGHGSDPGSETIPHAMEYLSPWATAPKPVPWSPGTTTAEPMCRKYRNSHAQSLCSATREAMAVRSPCTARKTSFCLRQLEKVCMQQRRPSAAPSSNNNNKF